jgi:hypothetical protein
VLLRTCSVFVVIAASAGLAAADTSKDVYRLEGTCGGFFECGGGGAHTLQGPSADGYQNLHGSCLVCIGETGSPSGCHAGCAVSSRGGDSLTAKVYAEALAAAELGDDQALARLARSLPEFIDVNHDRSAVQLKDCSGEEVVASLLLER